MSEETRRFSSRCNIDIHNQQRLLSPWPLELVVACIKRKCHRTASYHASSSQMGHESPPFTRIPESLDRYVYRLIRVSRIWNLYVFCCYLDHDGLKGT
jgi:predicted chitinase